MKGSLTVEQVARLTGLDPADVWWLVRAGLMQAARGDDLVVRFTEAEARIWCGEGLGDAVRDLLEQRDRVTALAAAARPPGVVL